VNSIERIRAVIAGEPVDRLPVEPMLMMFAAKHISRTYLDYVRDPMILADAQVKAADAYGIDCLLTCSDPARELIDIAGDASVSWEDSGPAIKEDAAALIDKQRLATFQVPDPLAPGRMRERIRSIETLRRAAGPGMSIVGWVEGPIALGAELRGINRIMEDFYDDPAFVTDLMDFCADVAIAYWEPQVEAGADTIGISDAAASLIGPRLYEQFLWPAQMRVLTAIKARRPEVVIRSHMCGQTGPLLPLMGELPVDIYELDYPVDLVQARRILGPGRVILGNVSTVGVLLTGTPEEVYESAASCHGAAGSRHIVGSGCEVAPATPPENLRALVEYARDHRPGDA
jgi:MtaA/CmuA family methyltransferase